MKIKTIPIKNPDNPIERRIIQTLADTLRPADRQEIWHINQLPPLDTVLLSISNSNADDYQQCFAVYDDDKLLAIAGCTISGYPWLLGTVHLTRRYRYRLHKMALAKIAEWFDYHDYLCNVVDTDNTLAIDWLHRLGFDISEPYESNYPDSFCLVREFSAHKLQWPRN